MKHNIAYLMHGAKNMGGGEYSIYYLIRGLRKELFSPIVFYAHENEIIRRLKGEGIPLVKVPFHDRITSVYRDEIKVNPWSIFVYLYHLFTGIIHVRKQLRKHDIGILHPHDNLSKIIGGTAVLFMGVKVVAHCRDLLRESVVEKLLIYLQIVMMDRIIAVSESNRRLFQFGKAIPGKVTTVYNGIDLEKYNVGCEKIARKELGVEDGNVVIGMIANFEKCKGHEVLFQAMEQLISWGVKNFTCLLIGDGREKAELEKYIKDHRLESRVKFLGYRTDVNRILRALDMVVMPSLQESFPRVLLEAMAMELPVIATNVGGMPESVEDGKTGVIVPPGDAKSLGEAVRFLVENPDRRREMGIAGRKRVESKFDIRINVRKTEQIYLEALEN